MANVDNPFGFMPIDWNACCHYVRPYEVASNAGAIAVGDLVAAEEDTSTAYGVVDRAAAGSGYIVGVALWFEWVDTNSIARWGSYYDAATGDTKRTAFVADDPRIRYRVQSSDTGVASQLTHVFANCDHMDTAPTQNGPYSGRSNHELDLSGISASNSLTCRIEARYPVRTNKFGSSTTDNLHGQYVVRISEHFRANTYEFAGNIQSLIPLPAV